MVRHMSRLTVTSLVLAAGLGAQAPRQAAVEVGPADLVLLN
jgi:hypothetical protein